MDIGLAEELLRPGRRRRGSAPGADFLALRRAKSAKDLSRRPAIFRCAGAEGQGEGSPPDLVL
ncbi:hypothetical protein ACRAWD_25830 [Caulobacter segnis]